LRARDGVESALAGRGFGRRFNLMKGNQVPALRPARREV
jgi:hypothetical protein